MSKREKLTKRPDVMAQWDYEKNELNPEKLTVGSGKKAWWKCNKGHSWEAVIQSRSNFTYCPYCDNKKILIGFNDLKKCNPALANEWDYEKNELEPTQISVGSKKKAWWICEKGHSWQISVWERTDGSNCPYCANKKVLVGFNDLQTCNPALADEWDKEKNTLTPIEVTYGSGAVVWWKCVRGHTWEAAVCTRSREHGCPVCDNKKVLAGFNDLQTLKPELSQEWAYEKNILLPSQVTPGSSKKVWWRCARGHSWKVAVCSRSSGRGCPVCDNKKVLVGFNDLNTINPQLSNEWDYDKNTFTPAHVTAKSNRYVWWRCSEKGHSWKARVADGSVGVGCPYCTGRRVLKGFNDLETLNPKLAFEWDYEKNDINPSRVTVCSAKNIWWKCSYGHSWRAKICNRSANKSDCPYCTGTKALKGFNDLKTLNPMLAEEWDYEKNTLTPEQVTLGSSRSVWWKCERGHSWKTTVCGRNAGGNCPYCYGLVPYTPKCVN